VITVVIATLDGVDHGQWVVYTFTTSMYLLDLGRKCVLRHREERHIEYDLRRDEEPVDLLRLVRCTVGRPTVLMIDLHVTDVPFTTRTTSNVLGIFPFPLPTPTSVGSGAADG
jgi:hypothetical protein